MNRLCLPLLIVYALLSAWVVSKMELESRADRIFFWAMLTFLSALMTVIVLASFSVPYWD